jgi:hypothetical protein
MREGVPFADADRWAWLILADPSLFFSLLSWLIISGGDRPIGSQRPDKSGIFLRERRSAHGFFHPQTAITAMTAIWAGGGMVSSLTGNPVLPKRRPTSAVLEGRVLLQAEWRGHRFQGSFSAAPTCKCGSPLHFRIG